MFLTLELPSWKVIADELTIVSFSKLFNFLQYVAYHMHFSDCLPIGEWLYSIYFSTKRETNKGGEGCPPKAADLQNDNQINFENTLGYQPEKPVKKPSGKKARKAAREAAEAAARAVEAEENEAKNFKPRYKSINYSL